MLTCKCKVPPTLEEEGPIPLLCLRVPRFPGSSSLTIKY
jgi:hypothetical protein